MDLRTDNVVTWCSSWDKSNVEQYDMNRNGGDESNQCPICQKCLTSNVYYIKHINKKIPCDPKYLKYMEELVDKNHRTQRGEVYEKPFGLSYNNEPTLITTRNHEIYKDVTKPDCIYWDIPINEYRQPRFEEAKKWVSINKDNKDKKIMMIKLPYIHHTYYKNPFICKYEDRDCIRLELVN